MPDFGIVGILAVIALVIVVVGLILIRTYASLLRKVGPNQALIVYGPRGTKVV
ncbi:MAG: hypothetical protein H0U76_20305, partial [Ktedonobacteraceae bacterium]|nr:hypothetical protein [Ktedonobacteraceae bacterium]